MDNCFDFDNFLLDTSSSFGDKWQESSTHPWKLQVWMWGKVSDSWLGLRAPDLASLGRDSPTETSIRMSVPGASQIFVAGELQLYICLLPRREQVNDIPVIEIHLTAEMTDGHCISWEVRISRGSSRSGPAQGQERKWRGYLLAD